MQKKHQNKQKDILFILISSFIVVVAWVSFNIYHIWITSTVPETITPQLDPIDPEFDTLTRQQLKSREQVVPLYDKQGNTVGQSGTSPTPPPVVAASSSAPTSSPAEPVVEPIQGLQGQ